MRLLSMCAFVAATALVHVSASTVVQTPATTVALEGADSVKLATDPRECEKMASNERTAEDNSTFWQREPNCCGQCTVANGPRAGRRGCLVGTDKTYCSPCGE
jgi:hypothetical protein